MSEQSGRYKKLFDKLGPVVASHFAGLTPKWYCNQVLQVEEQRKKAFSMGLTHDEFEACLQMNKSQRARLSETVMMAAQAKSKGPVTHDELKGVGDE